MTSAQATQAYADFLRNLPRFERALDRIITEWPNSCEHYLSNETMNRVAWLGQAAMCIDTKVPHGFRGGFSMLTEAEAGAANQLALDHLNLWLGFRNEPHVSMEQAGVTAKVNLY